MTDGIVHIWEGGLGRGERRLELDAGGTHRHADDESSFVEVEVAEPGVVRFTPEGEFLGIVDEDGDPVDMSDDGRQLIVTVEVTDDR